MGSIEGFISRGLMGGSSGLGARMRSRVLAVGNGLPGSDLLRRCFLAGRGEDGSVFTRDGLPDRILS
jgi:hypothetical protein